MRNMAFSIISCALLLLLGIALVIALVIITKKVTKKKENISDIDRIKRCSQKMLCVCIIILLLMTAGTVTTIFGLAQGVGEKTYTTESGITMDLQETYDGNREKSYVGTYLDDDGQVITYYVSEPNNDVSPIWESILQTAFGFILLTAVLCLGIGILNRIVNNGIPFTEAIANKLLLIGAILLASGIFKQTAVVLLMSLFGLWQRGANITFLNVDLSQVLAGLLIYLLSVIFQYGSRLQKTEDELI